MLKASIYKSPIGNLYLIAEGSVLLGAGFRSFEDLIKRMPLIFSIKDIRQVDKINDISNLISNYFEGDLQSLNTIEVSQPGSKFSQDVWKAMRKIPAGKTWSYSQLATKAKKPKAVRAVGTICGKNLIAPIVPCHRVIKTNGGIGNYGFGVAKKEWLLRHEGVL